MKKILLAIALCFFAMLRVESAGDVTSAQVNGTWKMKTSEFKIWALGQQRLQIEFFGTYEYASPQGPTANEWQGNGIARIEGDTAVFKPEGVEDDCKITLKFTGGKLIVTQPVFAASGITSAQPATTKEFPPGNQSSIPKFGESDPDQLTLNAFQTQELTKCSPPDP